MESKDSEFKFTEEDGISSLRTTLARHGFDKPILAGLAGILTTCIAIFYNYLAKKLGLILWDLTQIGSAIMTRGKDVQGFDAFIGGTLQNSLIGAISGLIFYYSLIVLGKKYIHVKGVLHALVFWMLTMTLYAYALGIPPMVFSTIKYNLVYNFEAVLWGLIDSTLLNLLIFKRITQETKQTFVKYRFSPLPARKQDDEGRQVRVVRPKKL